MRSTVKAFFAGIFYNIYLRTSATKHPVVKVMSVDETISELIDTDKSLARFGDGELLMIRGGDLNFQDSDSALSKELADIIGYDDEGLMISVQDIFQGLEMYVPESRSFWRDHFLFYRGYYKKLCNRNRIYASTSFSRCYITIDDKSRCAGWFDNIKKIWTDKHVVVVEGAITHNGVGNDLLESALDVKRIICPSTNAYGRLDEIRTECFKMKKDSLFIISLGPAAKPLVRDLYMAGYRAIDIGQLDTEYELFLAGANQKGLDIEKHRALNREDNLKMGYNKYLDEIVVQIEERDMRS